MPDRDVKTIRDLIYFQYAKIVGKSAFGPDAKKTSYGFIKTTFRNFVKDEKKWSDILREDKQLAEAEKACVYCGSAANGLQWEHIVPKTLAINERCAACDRIQGIHNQVWACASCNAAKGAKGLYHFLRDSHPEAKKFSDLAPMLAEKKYLKTIFYCHQCKGTLDTKPEGREITVMDLDL